MRKLTGAAFVSLDGVMQAPGGPSEDPTGGFDQGGWVFGVGDNVIDPVLGRLPAMAYSPIEQARLLNHPALRPMADRLGSTPAQVALAWTVRNGGMIAISKAGTIEHVRENRAAADLVLSADDLDELDRACPLPHERRALEML